MTLSQHLVEFRKSLFTDLDAAFLNASNTFLTNVVTDLFAQQDKKYNEILERLKDLEVSRPTIPELFRTNTHLYDIVSESLSHESSTMEEDSVNGDGQLEADVHSVVDDATQPPEEEDEGDVVDDATQTPEEEGDVVEDVESAADDHMSLEELEVDGETYYVDPAGNVYKTPDTENEPVGTYDVATGEFSLFESLQELEVDGEMYYFDPAGNVYKTPDTENDPVGTYDVATGEFSLFETEEPEPEVLEPFTYKGKQYLKDSENNIYLQDGSETDFHILGGKMVRKV